MYTLQYSMFDGTINSFRFEEDKFTRHDVKSAAGTFFQRNRSCQSATVTQDNVMCLHMEKKPTGKIVRVVLAN